MLKLIDFLSCADVNPKDSKHLISINPEDVSNIIDSEHEFWVILNMRNRNSFYVQGTFEEVKRRLTEAT